MLQGNRRNMDGVFNPPSGFSLTDGMSRARRSLCDFAPEEVVWIVTATEGGGVRRSKLFGVGISATICFAKLRMFRRQANADGKVRLAATHRLLDVKDGLPGHSSEPGGSLGNQVLHALGEGGSAEEPGAAAGCRDQFVQLLDLIAEFYRQRINLRLAGVPNSFHGLSNSTGLFNVIKWLAGQEFSEFWKILRRRGAKSFLFFRQWVEMHLIDKELPRALKEFRTMSVGTRR